jgi:hypothetical protein
MTAKILCQLERKKERKKDSLFSQQQQLRLDTQLI